MNALTVEVVAGSAPPLGDYSESQPWLDGDGSVCARIFSDGHARWIDWPALGRFFVSPHSSAIRVWPATGVAAAAIVDFFERRLQPIVLQGRGYQALHASAVEVDSVAVALTGPSGCGKSTLAYAMHLDGCPQLADDAVVIDTKADRPHVLLLPFAPQLRGESRTLRPAEESDEQSERRAPARSLPLGLIVLLEARSAHESAPAVQRIGGPAACVTVMAHAHVFDPADQERLVTDYARLVDVVPVFRLTYRPDMAELPSLSALVRGLAGNPPPRAGSRGQ